MYIFEYIYIHIRSMYKYMYISKRTHKHNHVAQAKRIHHRKGKIGEGDGSRLTRKAETTAIRRGIPTFRIPPHTSQLPPSSSQHAALTTHPTGTSHPSPSWMPCNKKPMEKCSPKCSPKAYAQNGHTDAMQNQLWKKGRAQTYGKGYGKGKAFHRFFHR